MKSLVDVLFLIKCLNAVIYYLGSANFAFGGCLNAMRRRGAQLIFLHGLATCSFGGLTRDVLLTPAITGLIVTPALFNSAESWIVATVMVFLFRYISRKNIGEVFDDERFNVPFLVLDTLGLGNFTMIGVSTAIRLGITSPAIQILYGVVTATGGGVFSILAWAKNKEQLILGNTWYYFTAAFSSVIACFGLSRGFNQEALCLACSALCAAVYIIRRAAAMESDRTISRCCNCRINSTRVRLTMKQFVDIIKRLPVVNSAYYTLGLRRKKNGVCYSC